MKQAHVITEARLRKLTRVSRKKKKEEKEILKPVLAKGKQQQHSSLSDGATSIENEVPLKKKNSKNSS